MRETRSLDYILLTILALIWASAFFNIKIATYSYGPLTIAETKVTTTSITEDKGSIFIDQFTFKLPELIQVAIKIFSS